MTPPVCRIFICTNTRKRPVSCGQRSDARKLARRLRRQLEAATTGQPVPVIESRCLGRCPDGPVLVTMPGRTWYTYRQPEDIDEIATRHILAGEPVNRLQIQNPQPSPPDPAAPA